MSDPKPVRRTSREREAARFAAAIALSFDLLFTGFSYLSSTPAVRSQFVALLERWDVVKGAFAVLALLAVGLRARSILLTIFAVVLGLIVTLEGTTGFALAVWVLERMDIDPRSIVAGGPAFLYSELAVLGGLALLAAVAILVTPTPGPKLKRVRNDLLMLLTGLFVFSVGVGFYAELVNSTAWKIVEEGGERVFMSLILGYVIGLLVVPPREV